MPLGARFPRSGIVLPGRLGGERKDRDVGCVGRLSFGVVADETDKGDSIELHTFLLVLPVGLGHRKASGRGSRAKQKLRSCRAPQRPRSSAETNGQDKGTQPNGSPLC